MQQAGREQQLGVVVGTGRQIAGVGGKSREQVGAEAVVGQCCVLRLGHQVDDLPRHGRLG
jgi:hypothetical protein